MGEKRSGITGAVIGIFIAVTFFLILIIYGLLSNPEDYQNPEAAKQYNIDLCLEEAYNAYSEDWDNSCSLVGKPNDCALFGGIYEAVEKRYTEAKQICIERYK